MGNQGSPLTPEEKNIIVLLKKYFDRTRNDPEEQELPGFERVAHAMDIGVATVKRVMSDHNCGVNFMDQEENLRGRPSRLLSDSLQAVTREYVRQANLTGCSRSRSK